MRKLSIKKEVIYEGLHIGCFILFLTIVSLTFNIKYFRLCIVYHVDGQAQVSISTSAQSKRVWLNKGFYKTV